MRRRTEELERYATELQAKEVASVDPHSSSPSPLRLVTNVDSKRNEDLESIDKKIVDEGARKAASMVASQPAKSNQQQPKQDLPANCIIPSVAKN